VQHHGDIVELQVKKSEALPEVPELIVNLM